MHGRDSGTKGEEWDGEGSPGLGPLVPPKCSHAHDERLFAFGANSQKGKWESLIRLFWDPLQRIGRVTRHLRALGWRQHLGRRSKPYVSRSFVSTGCHKSKIIQSGP